MSLDTLTVIRKAERSSCRRAVTMQTTPHCRASMCVFGIGSPGRRTCRAHLAWPRCLLAREFRTPFIVVLSRSPAKWLKFRVARGCACGVSRLSARTSDSWTANSAFGPHAALPGAAALADTGVCQVLTVCDLVVCSVARSSQPFRPLVRRWIQVGRQGVGCRSNGHAPASFGRARGKGRGPSGSNASATKVASSRSLIRPPASSASSAHTAIASAPVTLRSSAHGRAAGDAAPMFVDETTYSPSHSPGCRSRCFMLGLGPSAKIPIAHGGNTRTRTIAGRSVAQPLASRSQCAEGDTVSACVASPTRTPVHGPAVRGETSVVTASCAPSQTVAAGRWQMPVVLSTGSTLRSRTSTLNTTAAAASRHNLAAACSRGPPRARKHQRQAKSAKPYGPEERRLQVVFFSSRVGSVVRTRADSWTSPAGRPFPEGKPDGRSRQLLGTALEEGWQLILQQLRPGRRLESDGRKQVALTAGPTGLAVRRSCAMSGVAPGDSKQSVSPRSPAAAAWRVACVALRKPRPPCRNAMLVARS